MATPNEQSEKHIGETKGVSNHIHDLVHDLSSRLDGLWRYDQYMANADTAGDKEAKKSWIDVTQCVGCSVCMQVCPVGAISKVGE